VTDHFAFFGLPHRPELDEDALKEKYLQFAAQLHPDATAGDAEQFGRLQESYQTLLDPAARLGHLLALVFPECQRRTVSTQFPDLFMQVGQAIQKGRALIERRKNMASPLARAVMTGEINASMREVRSALECVRRSRAGLAAQLDEADAHWPAATPEQLADLISSFTFLARWESELAECEFQLANG